MKEKCIAVLSVARNNGTVIMNRNDYERKAEDFDKQAFHKIMKDPISQAHTKMNKFSQLFLSNTQNYKPFN